MVALKGKRAAWQGHLHKTLNGRCGACRNSECCFTLYSGPEKWLNAEHTERKKEKKHLHTSVINKCQITRYVFPSATAPASTLTPTSWGLRQLHSGFFLFIYLFLFSYRNKPPQNDCFCYKAHFVVCSQSTQILTSSICDCVRPGVVAACCSGVSLRRPEEEINNIFGGKFWPPLHKKRRAFSKYFRGMEKKNCSWSLVSSTFDFLLKHRSFCIWTENLDPSVYFLVGPVKTGQTVRQYMFCFFLPRCGSGSPPRSPSHSVTTHLSTCKRPLCSFHTYHSSNGDICIPPPPLPDCVYHWICFGVELNTKSNLWGMHVNRQVQITASPHAHATQIYQIWCGWHWLRWKIIGMSQHVSNIIMNDARKRKVTAEDRGVR